MKQFNLSILPKNLQMEISENIIRKDFTELEKAKIQKILIVELSKLKEQGKRNDLTSAEHSAEVGRITDMVGHIFSESGDNVEKRRQVVDFGNQEIIQEMDKTGNVNRAYIKIKKIVKPEPIPLPEGKYNVIYADPPWDVKAGPDWGSGDESKDLPYPTMSLEEIKALPVKDLAAKDAHLYLWTINKYIQESYDVARAWGFEPSCLLTWVKPPHGIGLGGTFIQTTEYLLFCRRGTLEALKRIDTTWFKYPRGEHSVKPEGFRKMIEEVSPGKKIELFARGKAPVGWTFYGNEVVK